MSKHPDDILMVPVYRRDLERVQAAIDVLVTVPSARATTRAGELALDMVRYSVATIEGEPIELKRIGEGR